MHDMNINEIKRKKKTYHNIIQNLYTCTPISHENKHLTFQNTRLRKLFVFFNRGNILPRGLKCTDYVVTQHKD